MRGRDIRPQVEEIVRLAHVLAKQGFDIYTRQYIFGLSADTLGPYPQAFIELITLVRRLDEEGILVKGLEAGIVDFPHLRTNGEEVYLCWKLGEPKIEFWHSIADGFARRRPLANCRPRPTGPPSDTPILFLAQSAKPSRTCTAHTALHSASLAFLGYNVLYI